MNLEGEQHIPVPKQVVWDGLNDPEILKACIPGCLELIRNEDGGFEATVQAKVGPVKAKFKGVVTLSNIDAPNSYTITGEGKGGAAGFAKGGADVSLKDAEDGGTLLSYSAEGKVGGKLAQIGSRLVDASAKKLAADFFETFSETVKSGSGSSDSGTEADVPDVTDDEIPVTESSAEVSEDASGEKSEEKSAPTKAALPPFVWISAVIAILGILILAFADS